MDSHKYFRSLMSNPEDFDKLVVYDNLRDLFFSTCSNFSEQVAVSWNSGSKTYKELSEDVLALSYFLKDKIAKGDNVGLVYNNEYDFVKSFFACACLGACCAVIPGSMPAEKIAGISKLFALKLLISNKDLEVGVPAINVRKIDLEKSWSIEEVKENVCLERNDPACIVFTGGTTGFPKGAVLSHRNLCRGAVNGSLLVGKIFGRKYLSLIPFSHIFGLIKNLLSSFLTGSHLYIVENPALFAKEAGTFGPETMVLTPGLCSLVLMLLKIYGRDFFGKEFTSIIAGGAHVPSKLIIAFRQFGIECYPGYGLTEATNLISGNGSIDVNTTSVGCIYPDQEAKIVNNELWVKGDNVFLGYFNNPEATKACLEDGWLKTGDLAHFDENEFLYIDGRVNNLIVLQSGLKIVPENIETLIGNHPAVKDSVVYKEKESDALYAEVLLYEINEDNKKSVEDYIINKVNKELDVNARVSRIVFRTEDFKRTPAMKIVR